MERIRNDYCWNIVKDWQKAQEMGLVKIQHIMDNSSDSCLRNLIELTLNNCFPLQFVCVKTDNEKYIVVDSKMKKFLQFINNETPINVTEEREMFFKELSIEDQNKILAAEVNSVWIKNLQKNR